MWWDSRRWISSPCDTCAGAAALKYQESRSTLILTFIQDSRATNFYIKGRVCSEGFKLFAKVKKRLFITESTLSYYTLDLIHSTIIPKELRVFKTTGGYINAQYYFTSVSELLPVTLNDPFYLSTAPRAFHVTPTRRHFPEGHAKRTVVCVKTKYVHMQSLENSQIVINRNFVIKEYYHKRRQIYSLLLSCSKYRSASSQLKPRHLKQRTPTLYSNQQARAVRRAQYPSRSCYGTAMKKPVSPTNFSVSSSFRKAEYDINWYRNEQESKIQHHLAHWELLINPTFIYLSDDLICRIRVTCHLLSVSINRNNTEHLLNIQFVLEPASFDLNFCFDFLLSATFTSVNVQRCRESCWQRRRNALDCYVVRVVRWSWRTGGETRGASRRSRGLLAAVGWLGESSVVARGKDWASQRETKSAKKRRERKQWTIAAMIHVYFLV